MDNQKQYSLLMEAFNAVYDNISESHFKVGDEVVCKKSGMEGEVVKLDKPDGKEDEKYYTVKREDGKKVKYSPNELKLAEEAKNGGVPKKKEEKFHTKLDKLVHSTFGSSPEEKKMKEEVSYSAKKARAGEDIGKPGKMFSKIAKEAGKRYGSEERGKKVAGAVLAKLRKEEVDIFDVILEHLVAEGYADTNQAAIAIMANMSEEWKQSILSEDPVQDFRDMRRAAENKGGARGPELSHGPDVKTAQPVKPGTPNSATIKPEPRSREFSHGGPGQKKASSTKPIPIPNPNRRVPDFVERRARG